MALPKQLELQFAPVSNGHVMNPPRSRGERRAAQGGLCWCLIFSTNPNAGAGRSLRPPKYWDFHSYHGHPVDVVNLYVVQGLFQKAEDNEEPRRSQNKIFTLIIQATLIDRLCDQYPNHLWKIHHFLHALHKHGRGLSCSRLRFLLFVVFARPRHWRVHVRTDLRDSLGHRIG